jgi:molybdopterin-guanine dinucleotide biosynthesis protein A
VKMNLIVTGEVQSGKTTWCRRYSRWLAARHFSVGGILCPEVRSKSTRIGYDILDIQSNRVAAFGRVASVAEADFAGDTVGSYIISYEGLKFAARAIQTAVENKCDVVFIDEIGHLELAGRGVIMPARKAYQAARNTVSVVRKSLLSAFLELFQQQPAVLFTIKDIAHNTSGGASFSFIMAPTMSLWIDTV